MGEIYKSHIPQKCHRNLDRRIRVEYLRDMYASMKPDVRARLVAALRAQGQWDRAEQIASIEVTVN